MITAARKVTFPASVRTNLKMGINVVIIIIDVVIVIDVNNTTRTDVLTVVDVNKTTRAILRRHETFVA